MPSSSSSGIDIAYAFVSVYWGKSFMATSPNVLRWKVLKALLFLCCEFFLSYIRLGIVSIYWYCTSLGGITILQAYIYFPARKDSLTLRCTVCSTSFSENNSEKTLPFRRFLCCAHVANVKRTANTNIFTRFLDMASSALLAQSVYHYLVCHLNFCTWNLPSLYATFQTANFGAVSQLPLTPFVMPIVIIPSSENHVEN